MFLHTYKRTIKVCVLLPILLISINLLSQNRFLLAEYTSQKSLGMKLDSTKYSKDMIKKLTGIFEAQFVKKYILKAYDEKSSFTELQSELKINRLNNNSSNFNNNSIYINYKEERFAHQKFLLDKRFLIKDSIYKLNWKITSASKNIGKYICYKAILRKDTHNKDFFLRLKRDYIEAWFAPELPYKYGPMLYNGLPGLILETNDGKTTIVCTSIELKKEVSKIKEPKKGKIVSKDKYESIYSIKMKNHKKKSASFLRNTEKSRN